VTAVRRPLPMDGEGIRDYMQRGYFGAPHSPLQGIRKVRPAEVVVFDPTRRSTGATGAGTCHRRRNGKPTPTFRPDLPGGGAPQSEVDVPYGVFLSGGVDSSLVAAVLRSLRPEYPLTAYTLRFHEPSFDEGGFAERVRRCSASPARPCGCALRTSPASWQG